MIIKQFTIIATFFSFLQYPRLLQEYKHPLPVGTRSDGEVETNVVKINEQIDR